MKRQILVVDDEENITRYLYRTLRGKDYDVHIANSGLDALTILEHNSIEMIICDMRMPRMNGYELLSIVKLKYSNIIRIILSGDSDRETIIKAAVDGTARSYLTKPVNNNVLKTHVARLFTTCDLLRQHLLVQTIDSIELMPVVPPFYEELLSLIKQNKSMDVIAAFISNDPEYAAKILRIANSALFNVQIGSITHALVYLGLETVKQLVLGTEIFRSFVHSGTDRKEIELLWEHSKMTNQILHKIYQKIHNSAIPDEYSCSGLLHDTGLLLMVNHFPTKYLEIQSRMKTDGLTIEQAEKTVLGFTHASLGAYLLDFWNLPQSIIENCLYHHNPFNAAVTNIEICSILHIADYFSWKMIGRQTAVTLCDGVFEHIHAARSVIEKTAIEKTP
jgi:HD-like signal output (HDOD) protein/ActR/RegA family two-component response regulator